MFGQFLVIMSAGGTPADINDYTLDQMVALPVENYEEASKFKVPPTHTPLPYTRTPPSFFILPSCACACMRARACMDVSAYLHVCMSGCLYVFMYLCLHAGMSVRRYVSRR